MNGNDNCETLVLRFGFVALDMLSVAMGDAGVYSCVVTTSQGQAKSEGRLTVVGMCIYDISYNKCTPKYKRETTMVVKFMFLMRIL